MRTPDGNDFLATDGWLAYVRNGKTSVDTRYLAPNITEARGWYGLPGTDGLGYENARLTSPVPTAPVSGTWSPEVETPPGAGPSSPVTHTLVTIDPAFHDMPPDSGKVQLDQTGAVRGPIAIDTSKRGSRVSHTRRGACVIRPVAREEASEPLRIERTQRP